MVSSLLLALLLLNTAGPVLANSVDLDQLASEEAKQTDLDLHCLSLNMWISIKNPDEVIWLAGNYKWAWHLNLFSMTRVKITLLIRPVIGSSKDGLNRWILLYIKYQGLVKLLPYYRKKKKKGSYVWKCMVHLQCLMPVSTFYIWVYYVKKSFKNEFITVYF